MSSNIYKRSLHTFFLKVHPDFFVRNRTWQKVNEASIAQLNEILEWAKDVKQGVHKPPPGHQITIQFHQRPDETSDSASAAPITSTFSLPKGYTPTDATAGIVERSVNKFLRDLLRRAKCLDDGAASLSQAEDQDTARKEQRTTQNRKKFQPGPEMRTLMDEAADAVLATAMPKGAPTVDDLISSDLVLFSKALSPLQCAVGMQSLSTGLPRMQYHRWYSMPLVIGEKWGIDGDISGSITVPWDFSPERFVAFINAEEETIRSSAEKTEKYAADCEGLIDIIVQEFRVDDVLITCGHAEAVPSLQYLVMRRDLLSGLYSLAGLTIELGYHYGWRANGTLILDVRTSTAQHGRTFEQKMAKMAPKFPELRERHERTKAIMDSMQWHLNEFMDTVKPLSIDVYSSSEFNSYVDRLEWSKEMFALGPKISQFDWSEFTFVLGPLEFDWDRHIVILPPNFDAENVAHYIAAMHKEAKEVERARTAAEDKAQKEQMQLRSHRAHDYTSIEGDSNKPLHDSAGSLVEVPWGRQHEDNDDEVSETAEDALERQRRHASSPLAEYMGSDAAQGTDKLRVEKPLHHPVSFASDDDLDDQLEWEGFYQSPYAMDRTPGEEEHEEILLANMNRNAKEAAVKKILHELKSKYSVEGSGKLPRGAKQLLGYKMGDVAKVNDPRTPPLTFPSVAKGTLPAEKKKHKEHAAWGHVQ